MIFPRIEADKVVQIGDKVRLSALKSFVAKGQDAITKVEIEPEAGDGFIDVTGASSDDWYLDWVYDGATRDVVISVRVTSGDPVVDPGPPEVITPAPTETLTLTISLFEADDEALFSDDSDLVALEPDVLRYVPEGRSSFIFIHRQAQADIMAWLDEQGYTDSEGNKLTKAAIVDVEEVRAWSRAQVLRIIFSGNSNAVGDIFSEKARQYESLAKLHRDRAVIRLDLDGDGIVEKGEGINIKSVGLRRA